MSRKKLTSKKCKNILDDLSGTLSEISDYKIENELIVHEVEQILNRAMNGEFRKRLKGTKDSEKQVEEAEPVEVEVEQPLANKRKIFIASTNANVPIPENIKEQIDRGVLLLHKRDSQKMDALKNNG